MAGPRVDLIATPCTDDSRLSTSIQSIKIRSYFCLFLEGEHVDFVKAIEISQLALKHRQNKNQKQRVILLICSTLVEQPAVLQTLAKKAKKNGLSIDIVNIGSNENVEKLQAFIETVNNADNSHFLHIENRSLRVPDVVISSPIAQSGPAAPGEIGHPASSAVDPSQDPELAEAIRQSLEEQKNTLAKASEETKKEQKAEEKKEEKKDEVKKQEGAPGMTEEEEEELKMAIMLSMKDEGKDEKKEESPIVAEERKEPAAPVKEQKKTEDLEAQLMQNPEFVTDLIKSLPGMTEEGRKKIISSVVQKEEAKKEEKKKEEETKKP